MHFVTSSSTVWQQRVHLVPKLNLSIGPLGPGTLLKKIFSFEIE